MNRSMEAYFHDFATAVEGPTLLAVSGGMDSMCLWYLFRKYKLPHQVAHMNYGLRGKESDADQKLVEKTAEKFDVKLHLKQIKKKEFKHQKMGIQEAARYFRYSWFQEIMTAEKIPVLATAHHLDDSVESFFINLDRGAGLKGLGGIRSTNLIKRPFLSFSREEIEAYVQKEKIAYRDDQSNFKEDYLRNWFRLKILKKWKKKRPHFLTNAAKSLRHLQEAQRTLDRLLEVELERKGIDPDHLPLQIPTALSGDQDIDRALFYKVAEPYGFHHDQIKDLLKAIAQKNSGAVIYSPSHRLMVDRDAVILDEQEKEIQWESLSIPAEGVEIDSPFFLSIDLIDREQVNYGKKQTEYLDHASLKFPLELRKWKEGDRIQPLGMKGKKKISDILIDAKVSLREKEKTFVLESAGEIVCLLGHRIADPYKVNENTTKVLRIQW